MEDFGLGYRREQISNKEIAIKITNKIVRQKPTTPKDLQVVVTRDTVVTTRDTVVVTRDTVVVTRDTVVVTRDKAS